TDTFQLHATDPTGAPVITINALTRRALPTTFDSHRLTHAGLRNSLLQLDWPTLTPHHFPVAPSPPTWTLISDQRDPLRASLPASTLGTDLAQADPTHSAVVIWALPLLKPTDNQDLPQQVHALIGHILTRLQHWLARPDTLHTPLVVVTHHGVATSSSDAPPELAHAAAWALVHTAQNEHPGRISLIDTDHSPASEHTLSNVFAALTHQPHIEPQLALRDGQAHIPRLTPTTLMPASNPMAFDAERTVLITGETGML
ncbi:SpnB-like Rossmann fold domain-containing protein, partial [Mycobacterium persicum]|uniref:SpnB-like Rossmann fold domain-containing protein n=1 Tax=Mycobacterium persicum TaxID=1487726 RepID=UPI000A09F30E